MFDGSVADLSKENLKIDALLSALGFSDENLINLTTILESH